MATSEDTIAKVVDYYLSMPQPSYRDALRAHGYSESYARCAQQWFDRPKVQAYLNKRRKEIAERNNCKIDDLIMRLKTIAFGDFSKFLKVQEDGSLQYDFSGATPEELSLVNELSRVSNRSGHTFKVGKLDPLKAMELLGRILGAFNDRIEVSDENSIIEQLRRGRSMFNQPVQTPQTPDNPESPAATA